MQRNLDPDYLAWRAVRQGDSFRAMNAAKLARGQIGETEEAIAAAIREKIARARVEIEIEMGRRVK